MMTLPAELLFAPRTLAGAGTVDRLLPECRAFGQAGLLAHGRSLRDSGVLGRLLSATPPGLEVHTWEHPGGEPTLGQLEPLLSEARRLGVAWVAAVGGGSVLDLAKACAGLLHAPLSAECYHGGEAVPPSRVPFAAAPTTAGTGSEASPVAVFTSEKTGVKRSFRHATFMPRLVVLDPALLDSCPRPVVAASGMDAFVQAVEAFFSNRGTWMSQALALEAAGLVASSLEAVFRGERGDPARRLLEGSYLAGLALTNARLGLVHGLAHPLGARYRQPHGLVCAVCLPPVLEFNRDAISDRAPALARRLGSDVFGASRRLIDALGIKSPFAGQPVTDPEGIIRETLESGSTAANPRPVDPAAVSEVLDMIFRGPAVA